MSLSAGLGGGGPSAHSDILTANPDNPSSQRALLEEIKRRGRACVMAKAYPDADALYSKSIEVVSAMLDEVCIISEEEVAAAKKDIAIFYSNRSLVRLEMGKAAEARDDAVIAAKADPTYIKAHYRCGQACNACGETAEALQSFEAALKLDPKNKALRTEVAAAKEKLKREENAMKAANEERERGEAVQDAMSMKSIMETMNKSNATTTTTSKAKESASKESTSSSTVKDDAKDSGFTKSDHVRGYKIRSDGKKTSYFDREITDDAKQLIGDIAPKKLDPNATGDTNDNAPKPIPATEGASAWNTAGTWEEKDVTPWAKETLTAALLTAEYILPDGSPSPGAHAVVSKVSKLEGHASYATVRGKKRYIYEFALTLSWVLTLGDDHTQTCHGEMTFPDIDGTVEMGEGYDITKYSVDGSSPPGTGPLLDRFVRDGGLRDSLHGKIDDWVRLFRATY